MTTHLNKLILFTLILLGCVSHAHAYDNYNYRMKLNTASEYISCQGYLGQSAANACVFDTRQAACSALSYIEYSSTTGGCVYKSEGSTFTYQPIPFEQLNACDNGTMTNTECTCNVDYTDTGSSCQPDSGGGDDPPPNTCTTDSKNISYLSYTNCPPEADPSSCTYHSPPDSVCDSSCVYDRDPDGTTQDCYSPAEDTTIAYCTRPYIGRGIACSSEEWGSGTGGDGSGGDGSGGDGSGGDGSGGDGSGGDGSGGDGSGGDGSGGDGTGGDGTGGDGTGGDGSGGDGSGGDDGNGSGDCTKEPEKCQILTNIEETLKGEGTDGDTVLADLETSTDNQLEEYQQDLNDQMQNFFNGSLWAEDFLDAITDAPNPYTYLGNQSKTCSYAFTAFDSNITWNLCPYIDQIHPIAAFGAFIMLLFAFRDLILEKETTN